MSRYSRGETFAGLPVVEIPPPPPSEKASRARGTRARPPLPPLPAADRAAWKLRVAAYDEEETFAEHFARFRDLVDTTRVTAVLVGHWEDAYENSAAIPRDLLTGAAEHFPALRHLYFGDISGEECEISWIQQCDVTPLLEAFPRLETLVVQGGTGLEVRPVRHEALRAWEFRTGGLPGSVVAGVGAGELPALERLEVWLGVEQYGGDAMDEDLAGVLRGAGTPALRHLGLMNSDRQDEIAAAVAGAPVVAQLEVLDLSMGTLGDEGAEALLTGQPLTHLRKLDLSHHFMSKEMVERVVGALSPAGVEVVAGRGESAEEWDGREWRYTEVSE
jgi:hypothetical protein